MALILFSAFFHAAAEEADPYFPLEKGNFWVYRGETKWTQENKETGKNEVKKATLTWRMEVVDTASRGYVFAARIKGAPFDLSWYEPGKERGNYLIVRVGTAHYHLFSGKEAEEAWKKILESENLHGLVSEGSLLLDAPLIVGKIYGEFAETHRGEYCYKVENELKFNSAGVKGPKPRKGTKLFEIGFRTRPSHSSLWFAPGVGIVGYEYVHHGTVSETDLQLIEYGKGTTAR